VVWHVEKMPGDALIPPLLLQPLLENAVYHGIEPSLEPGRNRDQHLPFPRPGASDAVNPYRKDGDHHGGNKMALANIRERLELHFDAEATLMTKVNDSSYQVHIVVPYVTEKNA